jgi:hypothetical protein
METVIMEAVALTLIGRRKEALVPESAEFQLFDLQALSRSYNEGSYRSRPSHREESLVIQAS